MFNVNSLLKRAKKNIKKIVFPEAEISERTREAVKILVKKKIVEPILIADTKKMPSEFLDIKGAVIVDTKNKELLDEMASALYDLRKDKGMTEEQAGKLVKDKMYFATMLVKLGYADGLVAGAEMPTSDVLRPALQIIRARAGVKTVSSCFMLCGTKGIGENGVVFAGDCALNINPTADQLCDITLMTAKTAKDLANIDPRVAMLSFSSFGSGGDKDESVLKVREAIKLIKKQNSTLQVDGEMQLDCAVCPEVAKLKAEKSAVAGKANVLIFPDLNSGNIGYKIMQRFGKLKAVGVIMQGFDKPINDLSRGCNIEDIVLISAVTSLQCE